MLLLTRVVRTHLEVERFQANMLLDAFDEAFGFVLKLFCQHNQNLLLLEMLPVLLERG